MRENRIKQVFVKTQDFIAEDYICPKCNKTGVIVNGNNSIECLNCDTQWNVIIEEVK